MAGTTANGIPYPTGTDRVMDGDNAMQAMAEKIDPSIAATQASATPQNGCTGYATAFRRGRVVSVQIDLTSNPAGTAVGTSFANIPANFRPPNQWFFEMFRPAASAGGSQTTSFEVTVNGDIIANVSAAGASTRFIGSVTYPLPAAQAVVLPGPDPEAPDNELPDHTPDAPQDEGNDA